jgi:hypothetical protein
MVRKIALGILLASVAGAASAIPSPGGYVCTKESFWFWTWENCEKRPGKTVAAPEIDPASAVGGLTLMVGGLLVLRGRRSKNAKA